MEEDEPGGGRQVEGGGRQGDDGGGRREEGGKISLHWNNPKKTKEH